MAASKYDPEKTGKPSKFMLYNLDVITEVEKYNLFFSLIRPNNYFFMIEPNEIVIGDVKKGFDIIRNSPEKEVFWVRYEDADEAYYPKIIKIKEGLHYPSYKSKIQYASTILDKDSSTFVSRFDYLNPKDTDGFVSEFKIRKL